MKHKPGWQIWAIPGVLALITILAFAMALLGTGVWHSLSWVSLSMPLIILLVKSFK